MHNRSRCDQRVPLRSRVGRVETSRPSRHLNVDRLHPAIEHHKQVILEPCLESLGLCRIPSTKSMQPSGRPLRPQPLFGLASEVGA